jgi:hypothetical protein
MAIKFTHVFLFRGLDSTSRCPTPGLPSRPQLWRPPIRRTRSSVDQNGFSALYPARSDIGGISGELPQGNRRSLLIANLRRHFHEFLDGNRHKFGVDAIPAETDIPSGSEDRLALPGGTPGDHPTGKIPPGDSRGFGFGHFPQNVLRTARIEGRGQDLHQNFAYLGHRHEKFFDVQIVQRAGISQTKGARLR